MANHKCTVCGDRFYHRERFDNKPTTCGKYSCQRVRKTQLQKERREASKLLRSQLPQGGQRRQRRPEWLEVEVTTDRRGVTRHGKRLKPGARFKVKRKYGNAFVHLWIRQGRLREIKPTEAPSAGAVLPQSKTPAVSRTIFFVLKTMMEERAGIVVTEGSYCYWFGDFGGREYYAGKSKQAPPRLLTVLRLARLGLIKSRRTKDNFVLAHAGAELVTNLVAKGCFPS